MNWEERGVEKRFAISSASSMTTGRGVEGSCSSSKRARRRMLRSTIGILASLQLSACFEMMASRSSRLASVPETSRCVKSRSAAGAFCRSGDRRNISSGPRARDVVLEEHLKGELPRLAPGTHQRAARETLQVRHLDGGLRRFGALAGARARLIHRVAGQQAEPDRVAGLRGQRRERGRDGVAQDLVVAWSLPGRSRRGRSARPAAGARRSPRAPPPGSSKAPGTRTTRRRRLRAPWRSSVWRALRSRASVIVGFHRAQITEKRSPDASESPSTVLGSKAGATRRGITAIAQGSVPHVKRKRNLNTDDRRIDDLMIDDGSTGPGLRAQSLQSFRSFKSVQSFRSGSSPKLRTYRSRNWSRV